MANPTSIAGIPAVIRVLPAGGSITTDVDREYTLKHDGENVTGAHSTDIIYLSLAAAVVPDGNEGADKAKLCSGDVIVVGPGVTTINFACAAADEATMTMIPGPRVDVDGQSASTGGVRAATSGTEEITAELGDVNIALDEVEAAIAPHLGVGPTSAMLTGGLVVAGVPAAEAAGDIAAPWLNLTRQLVDASHDLALAAGSVSDVAPAKMQKSTPIVCVQLTAPGSTAESQGMVDYDNVTVIVTVAAIDTNVVIGIGLSHDAGATYGLGVISGNDGAGGGITVAGTVATITANGTYSIYLTGVAAQRARATFVSEAGGANATLDFTIMAGN